MKNRTFFRGRAKRAVVAIAIALPLLGAFDSGAVAASGATVRTADGALTPPTQGMTPQQSVGKGEGELNLIAWEGYAQPEWVKPFEQADRLHGQRKVRRVLQRDGLADG